MSDLLDRPHAYEAVGQLRIALAALETYRAYTSKRGVNRSPYSDLMLLDHIDCRAQDNELTMQTDDAMVRCLLERRECQIDPSGYFWQGYADDVSDLLNDMDLLVDD